MDLLKIQSLKELVDFGASSYGEKIAYKYKENKEIHSKTFIDLKNDSRRFSNVLKKLNLLGKHIAVIGSTSYEWIVTYLGTVNSNSVIVPLDKELSSEEIYDAINRADVSAFVFDKTHEETAKNIKNNCSKVECCISISQLESSDYAYSFKQLLDESSTDFSIDIDNNKCCTILFTSGTTGKSKGVMLTHTSLCDNMTASDIGIEPGTGVTLSVLPIHHAYCFTCEILLGIYLGITVCINDSIMRVAKNLSLYKPNMLVLVPMIVESLYFKIYRLPKLMAKHGLGGKVTKIFSGGAYLNPDFIGKFKDLDIELIQGYGMSECSPMIASNCGCENKVGSVGRLLPSLECKIVNNEIWVKGPSVMIGYYKDDKNTKEALEDGWLKTGDLGYIDEGKYVYLTGRKKNLIILSNGENISPEELENKLSSNLLVKEALVYSEDEKIIAEVFPNLEYAEKKKVKNINDTLQNFVDTLNKSLPLYKQIQNLKIRDTEFEKTTSKKIKRKYN